MEHFLIKMNYVFLFMCLINVIRHIIKIVFKLINGDWKDKYRLTIPDGVLLMLSLSYLLSSLVMCIKY